MKLRLTQWFGSEVKPTLIGVYERDDRNSSMADGTPNYSYWNGEHWSLSGRTPDIARAVCEHSSWAQHLPWRGLAEPPSDQ